MLKSKKFWSVFMIIAIVIFDQATKLAAKSYLYPDKAVDFIRGFVEFRYAENTGMAFSMLSGARWGFIALTGVVAAACVVYMFKRAQGNLWLFWTLGVLVAGAIGNLIDRIYLGYVIDFINPTFVDFAIFNIADCAVTLGAISLISYLVVDMLKKENKESQNE